MLIQNIQKVVTFFCLKLKIYIIAELIELSFFGKLGLGHGTVSGYSLRKFWS